MMVQVRAINVAFSEVSAKELQVLSQMNGAITGLGKVIIETSGLDEITLRKLKKSLSLTDTDFQLICDSELSIFTR